MADKAQAITITYLAWNTGTNAGQTGDAGGGNHTLRWVKDGVSAAPDDTAPAEIDATNTPGLYSITLTAVETNADMGTLYGTSGTASVEIIPTQISFETQVGGAGSVSGTITMKDTGGTALADMEVWITNDVGGANVVAGTLETSGIGEVTFTLDAGTYYIWRQKTGYNLTNPTTLVVTTVFDTTIISQGTAAAGGSGEQTLSLQYSDIVKEVAALLNYGRTTSLTSEQDAQVDACIQRGIRQFYYPPALPGERLQYNWSFLQLVTTLATVADDDDYDLPRDFGAIRGTFTYSTQTGYPPIQITNENRIRELQTTVSSSYSSRPLYVAVRPKALASSVGQRFEALFWPTPDAAYTLSYRYHVLVDKLAAGNPYPYGGQPHSETVLSSCLAIAEQMLDIQQNWHRERFLAQLTASISFDRQSTISDTLGYNGDAGSIGINRGDLLQNVLYESTEYTQ